MKHLVSGIVVALAVGGAIAALARKAKKDAEPVEEVIPEMDFDNIINLYKNTTDTPETAEEQLSDADVSALNDVDVQIGEVKESVNPADLVEKTRKKSQKISDKEE